MQETAELVIVPMSLNVRLAKEGSLLSEQIVFINADSDAYNVTPQIAVSVLSALKVTH